MSGTKIKRSQIDSLNIADSDINADAAIATSKLADGQKLIKSDGSVSMGADLNLNSNRITGLAAPISASDAARLQDVQNATMGINVKKAVRAVATANIASLSGTTVVDGVTLAAGDRVLLVGQTTATTNGIWVVSASGWTRPSDFASGSTIDPNTFVFVSEGTSNGDSGWMCITNGAITVNTTAQFWVQFSGAGQIIAGNGLMKNGNTLQVGSSTTLSATAGQLELKTVGTAGTYRSVTVDAYGRITAGTNPTTLGGYGITDAQPLNADLTALSAFAYTGLLARTTGGTYAARLIAAGTGISVANGNGIAGNPTVSLATSGVVAGVYNNVTVDTYGRVTLGTNKNYINADNYVVNEVPQGTCDGTNKAFNTQAAPVAGKEMVFVNGILQEAGAGNDYTISGSAITFLAAPDSGSKVRVTYFTI